MKYIITEEQSSKLKEFDQYVANQIFKEFPELSVPLIKKRKMSSHNSGYGSGLDDYYSVKIYYNDESGKSWVLENGEYEKRNGFSNSHFEISDDLQFFYNLFGQKAIERFFLNFHGIDITDFSNFKYDWAFY